MSKMSKQVKISSNKKGVVFTVPAKLFNEAAKEGGYNVKKHREFEEFKLKYLQSAMDEVASEFGQEIADNKNNAGEVRVQFYSGSSAVIRVSDGVQGHMSKNPGEKIKCGVRTTIKTTLGGSEYVESRSRFQNKLQSFQK